MNLRDDEDKTVSAITKRHDKLLTLSNDTTLRLETLKHIFKTEGFTVGDVLEVRTTAVANMTIIVINANNRHVTYLRYHKTEIPL